MKQIFSNLDKIKWTQKETVSSSIRLFFCPFVHLFVHCPSIGTFANLFICSSLRPSIHLSVHSPTHLLSIHLYICSSIRLFIAHPFVCLFVCSLPIRLFICLFVHCPSVCSSVPLLVRQAEEVSAWELPEFERILPFPVESLWHFHGTPGPWFQPVGQHEALWKSSQKNEF